VYIPSWIVSVVKAGAADASNGNKPRPIRPYMMNNEKKKVYLRLLLVDDDDVERERRER
jgi:hypothetical protein